MADLALQILEPAHDAYVAGDATVAVHLHGAVAAGNPAGLFFKWYSALNPAATAAQPELNTAHGAASLVLDPKLDVGSHVITLSATDQDSSALAAVQAITRAAFTGGGPAPGNPAPRVVHRLCATLKTPVGATLHKASATVEFRAPARWCKEQEPGSKIYIPDPDYRAVHKIQFRFELGPDPGPDPAHTASVIVDLAAATFFIAPDDTPCVRWQGALPAQVQTGANLLTLFVEKPDGSVRHSTSRKVTVSL